jgi:hypothetical protein
MTHHVPVPDMAPTADSLRNDTLFIDAPLKDAPIISLSSLEDGGVVNRYSSDLPTVGRLGAWSCRFGDGRM